MKKITINDIRSVELIDRRGILWGGRRSRANGRSTVETGCPFCNVSVRAHLWSLAGGGKRCQCGALLFQTWGMQWKESAHGQQQKTA